jgi:hypothetical protein
MQIHIQLRIYIKEMYKRLDQEIIILEQKQRKIFITQGSNLSNSVSLCLIILQIIILRNKLE